MITGLGAAFFYLFAFVAIASAFMVIAARNPVHSVLYLILTFFNAAALFLLTGAEFLSMILLVVYIGAVAVLFLFVVMMLDVDFASMKRGALEYAPIGAVVGVILNLSLWFALHVVFTRVQDWHWGVLRLPLPEPASLDPAALILLLLACVLLFWWKRGLITTLVACSLAGVAWAQM